MTSAILRALLQLFDRRILAILLLCAAASLGCFVLVWYGLDAALLAFGGDGFAASAWARALGGLATLVLAWLLFPLLAGVFVGLFLERVAGIVEARHYPQLPRAPGLPWMVALACSLRLLALVLVVNLLLLVLLVVPVAYAVGWFAANGWLLGREYFELVALRREPPAAARSLRAAHRVELWAAGVATAFLLTLPGVNLVAPVFVTAVMLHRFEAWRRQPGR
jgi:uncharacterized protein involved in cysteine biosynthesis